MGTIIGLMQINSKCQNISQLISIANIAIHQQLILSLYTAFQMSEVGKSFFFFFFKEVSYARHSCNYLIKKYSNIIKYYKLK